MYTTEKPSCMGPAPLKEATSFKYLSDGSGRDFYITYNSGGLEAPYVPGANRSDQKFIMSLRSGARQFGQTRLSTPAEKQRMKKCRSAQKLLVRRLTATSKEWKEISKEIKRQSISRERELRSPQGSIQPKTFDFHPTRNEGIKHQWALYQNLNEDPEFNTQKASYPIYARSTRNLLYNKGGKNKPLLFRAQNNTQANSRNPKETVTSNYGNMLTNKNRDQATKEAVNLRKKLLENYRSLFHKDTDKKKRSSVSQVSSPVHSKPASAVGIRSNILRRNKRRGSANPSMNLNTRMVKYSKDK